jgi:hypothetical protein
MVRPFVLALALRRGGALNEAAAEQAAAPNRAANFPAWGRRCHLADRGEIVGNRGEPPVRGEK